MLAPAAGINGRRQSRGYQPEAPGKKSYREPGDFWNQNLPRMDAGVNHIEFMLDFPNQGC